MLTIISLFSHDPKIRRTFFNTRTQVLPSVCESLDSRLIYWFHKQYKLKKKDVLSSFSVGSSILSIAVCQHSCDVVGFFIRKLGMKREVEEMKAKRGWDWKRCKFWAGADFCDACGT